MFRRGDKVVNVLNGEIGKIMERWSFTSNPHYVDFMVDYGDGWVVTTRLRHLRPAMPAEARIDHP